MILGVVTLLAVLLTPPASGAADKLPGYNTIEEAGLHAAARAYSCSHYYECGGVIAKRPDGKYVVGPAFSDEDGTSVHISGGVPQGWKRVGDYHAHPCLSDTHVPEVFSPPDIIGPIVDKVVAFVLNQCTGAVSEFDPSKDSPNDYEVSPGVFVTKGRIIGHIPVDGAVVEPKVGL